MPTIPIDMSASGDLVPSPGAGKRIQVLGFDITSAAALASAALTDGTDQLWKTLAMAGSSGGGIVLPVTSERDMFCGTNRPLHLTLASGVAVAGSLSYAVVPVAT